MKRPELQTVRSYGALVLLWHRPVLQTVGLLMEPGESRETSGATDGGAPDGAGGIP